MVYFLAYLQVFPFGQTVLDFVCSVCVNTASQTMHQKCLYCANWPVRWEEFQNLDREREGEGERERGGGGGEREREKFSAALYDKTFILTSAASKSAP